MAQPLAFGVLARHALASRRILEEALPVVDDDPAIELVVEDAVAALRIAKQRRGVPTTTPWSGDALPVQVGDDGQWALAARILAEDPAHDRGLVGVDRPPPMILAILHDVVSVALAAGDAAGLDATDLPAPRLLREVLEEQRRHCAFEANMDLRHGAVGQRLDANAIERQLLIEGSDVGLTAG